jgi:hypothetical protein
MHESKPIAGYGGALQVIRGTIGRLCHDVVLAWRNRLRTSATRRGLRRAKAWIVLRFADFAARRTLPRGDFVVRGETTSVASDGFSGPSLATFAVA